MDAGLTAVSTRRKRKADKMNSLRCRYMSHMFHCVCMWGGRSAAYFSAQMLYTPLVKISLQWQLTKLLGLFSM